MPANCRKHFNYGRYTHLQRTLHKFIGYSVDLRRTCTSSFPDDGSAVVLQPSDSYCLILKLTI